MKICLINPPFTKRFCRGARWQASSKGTALWMPIWLIYAAGVLEKQGHRIHLMDCPAKNQSNEDLIREVIPREPGLIVIYTATPSIVSDLKVADNLKMACPKTKIVLVGPHVSVLSEKSLRLCKGADFTILREFDYTLRDLADKLENNEDCSKVPGLAYLRNGEYFENQPPPPIQNLDELPFSIQVIEKHLNIYDYHMDYLLYPWLQTYFGRGCYAHCIFCLWPQTLMGRKYRMRSMDNIFAELDYIRQKAPYIQDLMIDDDTFTFHKDRVVEFCERKLEGGFNLNWTANARPNITDVALLKLMKKAGCRALVVGYESGDPEILKKIKKGISLDQMEEFAIAARKADIQVHGDFIIGLPGETHETIRRTYQMALKLKPATMQVAIALPLPGTEFYSWLKSNGYLKTEDYSKFLNEEGGQNVVIDYPYLSGETMKKAMNKMVMKYYLRPAYILEALGRIAKDPREAVKFWHAGTMFFKHFLIKAPIFGGAW